MLYGQGEKWSAEPDILEDIVFIYRGDNKFVPTDVGTYYFLTYNFFKKFFEYFFYVVSYRIPDLCKAQSCFQIVFHNKCEFITFAVQ